ncbi:MAG TPA: PASTA domain-containing protein [Bacteroidia bacterium]|jgi:beta-lactam-binding protein with PASTA domain|nr:PASTA domain-containing protein [Bacteroidia bacterium]
MKNILGFLKSRAFFINLGIAVGSLLILFWLVFKLLEVYTHHGQKIPVPNFSGLKMNKLDEFIKGKQLKYQIVDSVFDTKMDKGVVIRQDPEAGSYVKQDRAVYLYVTSVMPPRISMPDFENKTLRGVVRMLESYGLRIGKPMKHKPDICSGCVIEIEYKGKPIHKGAQVERGAELILTIGEGRGGQVSAVPNLVGMNLKEAVNRLNENNLSEGAYIWDPQQKAKHDTASAIIYRQSPSAGDDRTISPGSTIDLYLSNDKSKLKNSGDSTRAK